MKKLFVLSFLFVMSALSYAGTHPMTTPFAQGKVSIERIGKLTHLVKNAETESYTWCVPIICDGVQYANVCVTRNTMAQAVSDAHTEAARIRGILCAEVGR